MLLFGYGGGGGSALAPSLTAYLLGKDNGDEDMANGEGDRSGGNGSGWCGMGATLSLSATSVVSREDAAVVVVVVAVVVSLMERSNGVERGMAKTERERGGEDVPFPLDEPTKEDEDDKDRVSAVDPTLRVKDRSRSGGGGREHVRIFCAALAALPSSPSPTPLPPVWFPFLLPEKWCEPDRVAEDVAACSPETEEGAEEGTNTSKEEVRDDDDDDDEERER